MGLDTSPSPTIANVLAEFAGIMAMCLGCGHHVELHADKLPMPRTTTLFDAASKMKCSRCKSKDIVIGIIKDVPRVEKQHTPDLEDTTET